MTTTEYDKFKTKTISDICNAKSKIDFKSSKYDNCRDDKDVAIALVKNSTERPCCGLSLISDRLRDDIEIAKVAVTNGAGAFFKASDRLKGYVNASLHSERGDLSKENILLVWDTVKELESRGCSIPEGHNIFKVAESFELANTLRANLTDKKNSKQTKILKL